jgi:signal transduction histidine kinase
MQGVVASEARLSAFAVERIDAFERNHRSLMGVAPIYLLVFVAVLGSAYPAVSRILGVDRFTLCVTMTVFLVVWTSTTVVYHLKGWRSRLYRVCDWCETLMTYTVLLVLVYASRGGPLYWFLYLALVTASSVAPRIGNIAMILAPAGGTVTAFTFLLVAREVELFVTSLLFTAGATFVAFTILGQQRRLSKALEEREELRGALSAFRVEEERERIARDLHDGVAGSLTALTARLDLLRNDLDSGNVRTLGADLAALRERSMRGVDDLRSIVWALRHPEGSLSETIAYVRTRCAELCPAEVSLSFDAPVLDPMLDGSLRLHVLRVLQEGVRNSLRHGKAGRIHVQFDVDEEFLELTVEDDGVGMPSKGDVRRGGLLNIERRARERGGSVAWTGAASGQGTKLVVRLGVAPEAAGEVVA